jgi:hypothetical protein
MAWTAPATQTTNTHMTAAIWNEQVTNNLAFLGTNHDHTGDAGDGATITSLLRSGTIGIFDAACPGGWTRVSAWDGKFLLGSSIYVESPGGVTSHTHTTAAHVHMNAGHTHGWSHAHTGPSHTHSQVDIGAATNQVATYKVQTEADAGAFIGNQMWWGGAGGGAGPKKVMASGVAAAGTGSTGNGAGATSNGGTADTESTAGAATGSADNLPTYIDVVFCKKD